MKPLLRTNESVDAWFGKIPAHWKVARLASLYGEAVRASDPALPVLSISIHDGISDEELADEDRERRVVQIEDKTKYQRVAPNDLAYNMMRAWQGALGAARVEGLVSPAYVVAKPLREVRSAYIELLLRTPMGVEEMRRFSKGITDFRKRLYWDDFRDIRVCVPPLVEQEAILSRIERETTRIDALIAQKSRFIELLGEKQQALIARVVTKGLNRHASMKQSGVHWLGRVPLHWKTIQLGRVAISRCDGPFGSGLKSEHYVNSGARVIRLQNIGFAEFRSENAAHIGLDYWMNELGGGHDVRPDDLLIAGLGDDNNPLGRACVAPDELGPALVKADCYRFRLGSELLPKFAAFLLSATARAECGFIAIGATRERLNLGLAASRKIVIPPIHEQKEIVMHLESAIAGIGDLVRKTERSMELLREHRTALVTAAVTGKIDLRDAA